MNEITGNYDVLYTNHTKNWDTKYLINSTFAEDKITKIKFNVDSKLNVFVYGYVCAVLWSDLLYVNNDKLGGVVNINNKESIIKNKNTPYNNITANSLKNFCRRQYENLTKDFDVTNSITTATYNINRKNPLCDVKQILSVNNVFTGFEFE
jgi:hypothetical protein